MSHYRISRHDVTKRTKLTTRPTSQERQSAQTINHLRKHGFHQAISIKIHSGKLELDNTPPSKKQTLSLIVVHPQYTGVNRVTENGLDRIANINISNI